MDLKKRKIVFSFKKMLMKELILAIFDFVKKIIIETDINKIVLGSILS